MCNYEEVLLLKKKYKKKLVNIETLRMYVSSGYITQADYYRITGEEYEEDDRPFETKDVIFFFVLMIVIMIIAS